MEELTISVVRRLLGRDAEHLSDDEIERFIEQANRFASNFLDILDE